jgi:biopolymer transport protein TolR
MHRRKLMAQINVVPFIDVILVLLIVFMIATPALRSGEIELPSVGQPLSMRDGSATSRDKFTRTSLVARVLDLQRAKERPVVIAADKNVRYDEVVSLLSALHAQGVKRVGLVAKEGG